MHFVWISLLLLSVVAQAQAVKLLVQSSPLAGFQYHAGASRRCCNTATHGGACESRCSSCCKIRP